MTEMIPKHYIKSTTKDNGLSVINANKYIEAHLEFGNHRHSFYEVLLILQGNGIHQIDFTNYEIQNNSISFLAPGQVHNLKKSFIKKCIILIFNEAFIYKANENSVLLKQLSLIFNQVLVLELNTNELKELKPIVLIIENELRKENQRRDVLFYALNLMLSQILSFCKEQPKAKFQPTTISKKRYFEFLALVESNYSNEHSVQYYARQLNIHPKRLNEITPIGKREKMRFNSFKKDY